MNPRGRRSFLLGAGAALVAACTGSDSADPAPTSNPADPDPTDSDTTDSDTTDSDTTDSGTTDGATSTTSSDAAPAPSGATDALIPAMFESLAVCALTADAAAGPFPTKSPLDRRDIHEGYPGHRLRLGMRVVDNNCVPVPGARVEIWHTDASGDYSEYEDGGDGKDEGEGSTFCRGIQTANADGILEFQTIYPGWYPGRAVHIHTRVYVGDDEVLTGQLYLDEAYTETVYSTGEYAQFGLPDTTWDDDRISGDPIADGSFISVTATSAESGGETLGLVNIGVE